MQFGKCYLGPKRTPEKTKNKNKKQTTKNHAFSETLKFNRILSDEHMRGKQAQELKQEIVTIILVRNTEMKNHHSGLENLSHNYVIELTILRSYKDVTEGESR